MASFDLLKEPWIPCVNTQGIAKHLNLQEAVMGAHEQLSIQDPIHTVEFGLYRLLTALVTDIFQVNSLTCLETLLDKGQFDADAIGNYFAENSDRFDLFHPEHPFLQTPKMKSKPKPIAGLLPLIPSGTNANHFHHMYESEFVVGPSAAARLLAMIAPFMTAGGTGLSPSINGAPPWYVLIVGRNLFETLCLNICTLPLEQSMGIGRPSWREDIAVEKTLRTDSTLLESLTWQPRRIQFLPAESGTCSITGQSEPLRIANMYFEAGYSWRGEVPWVDPNVSYKITGDKRIPFRPQEDRELWRDTGPLALLKEEDYESVRGKVRFDRPSVVNQYAILLENDTIEHSRPIDMVIYGMRTDMKMKVFEWQCDRLSLPAPLIWQSRFHRTAQEAIDTADRVGYEIKKAVKIAYPRKGKGNQKANDTLITSAQRDYWSQLRNPFENTVLQKLASIAGDDDESRFGIIQEWLQEIRSQGIAAFESAVDDLDADAQALRRQVEARRMFFGALNRLLNQEDTVATA